MRLDTIYLNSNIFSKIMVFMVLMVMGLFLAVVNAMPDISGLLLSDLWKLLSNLVTL